jgi:hypothetical protein
MKLAIGCALIVVLPLLPGVAVRAQTEATTQPTPNYGTTRQLRTCPDRAEPKKGRPSVSLATTYVACTFEDRLGFSGALTFVGITDLQFAAKTRKVSLRDISTWPEIDQTKPVYILRGTYSLYKCFRVSATYAAGANCNRTDVPKANGTCWQDNFGEWSCFLVGKGNKTVQKVAAPQ